MTDTTRLDRIESKLDKLNDIFTSVARMEEKLLSVDKETQFLTTRLLRKETKIVELEKKIDSATATLSVLTRVFWMVLSALVPIVVGSLILFYNDNKKPVAEYNDVIYERIISQMDELKSKNETPK